MKHLVTIDFDIIMAPSIQWYNGFVPKIEWEDIIKDPIAQLFKADLTHYKRLTEWLIQQTTTLSKEQIIFIRSHEQLVDCIDMNEYYEIINIDHHHDLGYVSVEDNTIDCANWMKVLFDKRIVNKYTWINNFNSDYPTSLEYPTEIKALANYNLATIKPDILVICLSPEWVPPDYQNLFYLWMDTLNILYQTHFELH